MIGAKQNKNLRLASVGELHVNNSIANINNNQNLHQKYSSGEIQQLPRVNIQSQERIQ